MNTQLRQGPPADTTPAADAGPDRSGRASRMSVSGLLRRLRRDGRGAALVVSVLVLAVAALVAATPSAFGVLTADELRATIAAAPPPSRYLVATSTQDPTSGPAADPAVTGLSGAVDLRFGAFADQLATVRAGFPEPLRTLVGPAEWSITRQPLTFDTDDPRTDPAGARVILVTRVDISGADRVEMVTGRWPTPGGAGQPVAIAISEDTAAHLAWAVGSRHGPYVVSGIFRARDPDGDYWALNPGMVKANVFDDSNSRPRITATVFVDPVDYVKVTQPGSTGDTIQIWYPLHLDGLSGTQADTALAQLRGVTARTTTLSGVRTASDYDTISSLTLVAAVIPTLQATLQRILAARSVLTVATIGPLGAAIAVLLLGVRAFAGRRRGLVGLLAVRGASGPQLRSLLATEGLLMGVLPAAAAVAVVWTYYRADASPSGLVLGLVTGLIPAVALAVLPIPARAPRVRADSAVRSAGRLRWLLEVAVCALAAVSAYLLFAAGLQTSGRGAGVDILVAATPLLLSGAACVLVLRLYPVPLRLLVRTLRRSRSAVSFLGAVRALRDPAVGVAPVLAVVTGVSIAVFSAVTLSTITAGTRTTALTDLGAPVRVDGPLMTDALFDQMRAVPGVAAAARIASVGVRTLRIPGQDRPQQVTLYLADTAMLSRVQAGVPGAAPVPKDMTAGDVPGLVGSPDLGPAGSSVSLDGRAGRILGIADLPTGLGRSTSWVLADGSDSAFAGFHPRSVLIAPTHDADLSALTAAIQQVAGPEATVRTAAQRAAQVGTGPIAHGLRTALVAAIVATAIAAAAAVVLTLLLNNRSRSRLLAILRILGWSLRQRRGLAIWEQAPTAVVALVVGGALGVAATAMVRSVVDLRPFTGGADPPPLSIDALQLGLLLGGFVAVVAAAIGVGLRLTRRTTAAAAVKLDEE